MKRFAALVFLTVLLLTGCQRQYNVKLVTQISVDWEPETVAADRVYRDYHKMERVLNRMRQLGQGYRPKLDPEQLGPPAVTITVDFSDGSRHLYRLKGESYISTDNQGWQQVDTEKAQRLQFLLKALPGDG